MKSIIFLLALLVAYASAQGRRTCDDLRCGRNAICREGRRPGEGAYCVCREGTIGDPYRKCCEEGDSWCWGDPHCKTFDGTFYDYQGTCPYVWSKPCGDSLKTQPDLYYEVKARNKLFSPKSPVSYVSDIEVLMYDQVLHVDEKLKFTVNGVNTPLPYYYPTKEDAKLVADLVGGQVHIRNEIYVTVMFSKSLLKMKMPRMDEYLGRDGVCGHAGNLNMNCTDDLIGKDGVGIERKPCVWPLDKKSRTDVANTLDTWITEDFLGFDKSTDQCRNGKGITPDLPECDAKESTKVCQPIKDAAEGKGPFAACKAMGQDELKTAYEGCTFDLCLLMKEDKNAKCNMFKNFVDNCQAKIKNVGLPLWRAQTLCPLACPGVAKYNSCISGCRPTCADPVGSVDQCEKPCFEGCECPAGTLLNPRSGTCVIKAKCPCFDVHGSPREEGNFWYHDNCSKASECSQGTIYTDPATCWENSHCGTNTNGYMDCLCDAGFVKDQSKNKCNKA